MKYRLVKATKASGFTMWVIQRRWMFSMWDYVDAFTDEHKAKDVYTKLVNGAPEEKREIIFTNEANQQI